MSLSRNHHVAPRMGHAFFKGLSIAPTTEEQLAGALHHVLSQPGSLVRADLAFRLSRAFGLTEEAAEALAVGIEYMHTASLLFDDMPAMDDATTRRGQACVHRLYGEATSTLAALALINRGYALLWQAMATSPARQAMAGRLIERCVGLDGMLTGQSQDLRGTHDWMPREVFRVSMGKTVALIRLTLVLPALLGWGDDCQLRWLDRLGVYWGLSYQILDDLKDLHGQRDSTGKTGQRDVLLGRPNLALAESVDDCQRRLSRLLTLSERTLENLVQAYSTLRFLNQTQNRLVSERSLFSLFPGPEDRSHELPASRDNALIPSKRRENAAPRPGRHPAPAELNANAPQSQRVHAAAQSSVIDSSQDHLCLKS